MGLLMDDKKLLIDEWNSVSCNLIEEGSGGNTKIVAKGQFAYSNTPTANNRVYSRQLWEREITKKKNMIGERKVYGELDHPGDGKTRLERASHIVTALHIKPNGEVYGEADVMDTSKGKDLKAILKAGGKVGVSSRGFGTTRTDGRGNEIVQEDYQLVTFDFVADPAVASSYPDFKEEDIDIKGDLLMNLGELRQKYPELVKQLQEEIQAKSLEQQKSENAIKESLKKDIKEEFEKKLIQNVQKAKDSIREEVESEMKSDPAIAGAKVVLEDIVSKLSPFLLPEDIKDMLQKKDDEINRLKEEIEKVIADEKEKYEKLEGDHKELTDVSKKIGYEYYVEQRLKSEDNPDLIRNILGDLTRFNSLEKLGKAIDEAIETSKEVMDHKEEENEKIEKLKEENERLKSDNEKLFNEAKNLALRIYLERKLDGEPQRIKIKKIVEENINSGNIKDKSQIDEMIDTYKADNPVSEEFTKINSTLRSSRESKNNDDSKKTLSEGNVLGVEMQRLCELSGV